jgi:hypothetical protein
MKDIESQPSVAAEPPLIADPRWAGYWPTPARAAARTDQRRANSVRRTRICGALSPTSRLSCNA